MPRNAKNLARHELIGTIAEIVSSSNPSLEGVRGRVLDETQNTLKIETDKKVKTIIKSQCVFRFTIPESGESVLIDGRKISASPEDRIKKRFRR